MRSRLNGALPMRGTYDFNPPLTITRQSLPTSRRPATRATGSGCDGRSPIFRSFDAAHPDAVAPGAPARARRKHLQCRHARISSRATWRRRNSTAPAPASAAMGSLAMTRTSASHIAARRRRRDAFSTTAARRLRDAARRQRGQPRRRDAEGRRQPDGLPGGDLALQPQPRADQDRDRQALSAR